MRREPAKRVSPDYSRFARRAQRPEPQSLAVPRSLAAAILLDEIERRRVHAVGQPGRPRSVVEDVAEMRAAEAARQFGAHHAVSAIGDRLDSIGNERGVKARPSAARVVLGPGIEQLVAAAYAEIGALIVQIPILPGEGALGALAARDFVLLRGEQLAPFFVGLCDLPGH